ncbi:hypothetical protein GQX74_009060, partial [Glossina fuscipes]
KVILQHTFVLIVYKLDENCLKLEVARISSSRRSDTKLDAMHMINGYKRIQLPLSTQFITFTYFQTNRLIKLSLYTRNLAKKMIQEGIRTLHRAEHSISVHSLPFPTSQY